MKDFVHSFVLVKRYEGTNIHPYDRLDKLTKSKAYIRKMSQILYHYKFLKLGFSLRNATFHPHTEASFSDSACVCYLFSIF